MALSVEREVDDLGSREFCLERREPKCGSGWPDRKLVLELNGQECSMSDGVSLWNWLDACSKRTTLKGQLCQNSAAESRFLKVPLRATVAEEDHSCYPHLASH